jgi:hypothetical protein
VTGLEAKNPGRLLLAPASWPIVCSALRLSPREAEIVQGVFDDLWSTRFEAFCWNAG